METSKEVSEKAVETEGRSPEETEHNVSKKAETRTQPLCTCPQKCYERVPTLVKESLLKDFSNLSDSATQNEYLQSYIEMRSVYKRLWSEEERVGGRLQRRVSCKYKIPLEDQEPTNVTAHHNHAHSPKIHTNSKGKTIYAINVKQGVKTIEVCQKAFMNIYGITEKRIRLQREKLIAKLRSQSLELELKSLQNGIKGANQEFKEEEWTPEQAILDAFFGNQLWRPEYIGMSTESKVQPNHEVKA